MKRLDIKEFVRKSNLIHNLKYNYDQVVYKNNSTKVIITCLNHGEFSQTPHDHLQGKGCKLCRSDKLSLLYKKTKNQFISKAHVIHNNKYDYSNVKYQNNKTPVEITCFVHGKFYQRPDSHLQGLGCHACSGKMKLDYDIFVKRAKLIHGIKYNYSKSEYVNIHAKTAIGCPQHGVFYQEPNQHINLGQGCPTCNESHGERLTRSYLDSNKINYENQYRVQYGGRFNFFVFDFYLKNLKTAIEFNGKQHYMPVQFKLNSDSLNEFKRRIELDKIKSEWCQNNQVHLIIIPYWEIDNIQIILNNHLFPNT